MEERDRSNTWVTMSEKLSAFDYDRWKECLNIDVTYPFHIAARQNFLTILQTAYDVGALDATTIICGENDMGQKLVEISLLCRKFEIFEWLRHKFPQCLSVRNNLGFGLLHLATLEDNTFSLGLLLSTKVFDVNEQNNYYASTPLHYAIESQAWECCRILLGQKNIDLSRLDKGCNSPLMVACHGRERTIPFVQLILSKTARPDWHTLISSAICSSSLPMVKFLWKKKGSAMLDVKTITGFALLCLRQANAYDGWFDVCRLQNESIDNLGKILHFIFTTEEGKQSKAALRETSFWQEAGFLKYAHNASGKQLMEVCFRLCKPSECADEYLKKNYERFFKTKLELMDNLLRTDLRCVSHDIVAIVCDMLMWNRVV